MGFRLRCLPAEGYGIQPPTLCGLWIVLPITKRKEGFDVDVSATLGHGLAIGVGYAIANPKEMVFVLLSDGELDEGQTIEAMKIINRLKIKNIVVLVDWNDLSAVEGINKEEWMQFSYRPYYSIKGHGWGKLENKVASHYAIINKEILSEWKKNSQRIEDERLKRIEDGKKLLKSLKRKKNVR